MRVLIACEYSGIVRDAFIAQGHDVMSCDLLPTESPGPHYQGNVLDIINKEWDLLIAFPPCTYLTTTANKWLKEQPLRKSGALVGDERKIAREKAIQFFLTLTKAPIERIAIENPVGIMSSLWKKSSQIIQPFYFGDSMQKTTCLWLKNLPPLLHSAQDDFFYKKSHVDRGEMHHTKSGKTLPKWYIAANSHVRSKTFSGIAQAMAEQWGSLAPIQNGRKYFL